MVWRFAYDRDKAQMLALHVLRCTKKIEQRHVSRRRLITQLKKVRSLKIDKKLAVHVDELERRIQDLVAVENKIKKAQAREDFFHRHLLDKINRLDNKLQQYLEHHKVREKRFHEIEKKVFETLTKDQKVERLKGQIKGLEVLYEGVVAARQASPQQLDAMKQRIKQMQERLDRLKKERELALRHPVEYEKEHVPPRDLFASVREQRKKELDQELGPAPPPPSEFPPPAPVSASSESPQPQNAQDQQTPPLPVAKELPPDMPLPPPPVNPPPAQQKK